MARKFGQEVENAASLGVSGYSASIGPSAASNNKHFINKKVSSPKPPPYYTSQTNEKKF